MGLPEIRAYLSHVAINRNVGASPSFLIEIPFKLVVSPISLPV